MKNDIRVLIADDHYIVRNGIIKILREFSNIFVVGDVNSGTDLISQYSLLKPDVALVDISFQDINGFKAAREILKKNPDAKILFLTMHRSDTYIYKAYKLGAMGLLSKDITPDELYLALKKVADGDKYFQFFSNEEALNKFIQKYNPLNDEMNNEPIEFTYQEDQILRYICQGLKSADMAIKMSVTIHTINHHRAQLIKKLNLKSGAELITYAAKYGS